jgi:hypothetical protein
MTDLEINLLDYIKSISTRKKEWNHACNCNDVFANEAEDILSDLSSFTKNNKWISIKDRWPNPFEPICIFHSGSYVTHGFSVMVRQDVFYEYALIDYETERAELNPIGPGRVTHWMELPEPPNE